MQKSEKMNTCNFKKKSNINFAHRILELCIKRQVKWLQLQHTPLNTFLCTVDCAHDTNCTCKYTAVQNETLFSTQFPWINVQFLICISHLWWK